MTERDEINKPIPCCEACRYGHFEGNRGSGSCRANPPQVVMIDGAPDGAWPIVYDVDWCGHFEPRDDL